MNCVNKLHDCVLTWQDTVSSKWFADQGDLIGHTCPWHVMSAMWSPCIFTLSPCKCWYNWELRVVKGLIYIFKVTMFYRCFLQSWPPWASTLLLFFVLSLSRVHCTRSTLMVRRSPKNQELKIFVLCALYPIYSIKRQYVKKAADRKLAMKLNACSKLMLDLC